MGREKTGISGTGRQGQVAHARIRLPAGARKQPRQERSRLMVQAILQAAAEVFARHGYARATTNKIAERAGVSVGSLYQYFPDKDCLLQALLTKHHEDVHRIIDATIDCLDDHAIPLQDCLRKMLGDLVAVHQQDPDLTRALSDAVLGQSNASEADKAFGEDVVQARRITRIMATRPDVRKGNYPVMAALVGQATGQLTRWLVHEAPAELDRQAIVEEILQLLLRYLRTS